MRIAQWDNTRGTATVVIQQSHERMSSPLARNAGTRGVREPSPRSPLNQLISEGIIGVKTGAEIFGSNAYKDAWTYGLYRYDPLYDKMRFFSENDYYFVLYNNDYVGLFNDMWSIKYGK